METAMLEEPALYSGRLVRPVVVEHEVDIEMLLHAPVDALEELDELLCTVPRMALADDQAGLHIERSKQRRGAVALVIVGHRRRAALLQRKARLGAIQRLNLALFVDAQHQRSIRWIHVEPDDISHLLFELWIVRYLEPTYQMRLECVAFGGNSLAVLDRTLRFTAADSGFLPGGRVLSRNNPSTPSAI